MYAMWLLWEDGQVDFYCFVYSKEELCAEADGLESHGIGFSHNVVLPFAEDTRE